MRRTKGIDHLDHAQLIQVAEEINPIGDDEVRAYQLHLRDVRKLSFSTCNIVTSALRFFYRVVVPRAGLQRLERDR